MFHMLFSPQHRPLLAALLFPGHHSRVRRSLLSRCCSAVVYFVRSSSRHSRGGGLFVSLSSSRVSKHSHRADAVLATAKVNSSKRGGRQATLARVGPRKNKTARSENAVPVIGNAFPSLERFRAGLPAESSRARLMAHVCHVFARVGVQNGASEKPPPRWRGQKQSRRRDSVYESAILFCARAQMFSHVAVRKCKWDKQD